MLGRYMNWCRIAFLAAAIGLTLLLTGDAQPVQASHTRIFVTRGGHTLVEPIFTFINGPTQTIDVRVQDVDDPTGVSAFEVNLEYRSDLVTVTFFTEQVAWLQSTGRTATCTTPTITAKSPTISSANVSCNTFLPAPPYGPRTSYPAAPALAVLYLQPGSTAGQAPFTLTSRTHLVNTPVNPDQLAYIPTALLAGNLIVARCADVTGDLAVSVADIVRVVQNFGTTNTFYDLNLDGRVSISDITLTVQMFGMRCPS